MLNLNERLLKVVEERVANRRYNEIYVPSLGMVYTNLEDLVRDYLEIEILRDGLFNSVEEVLYTVLEEQDREDFYSTTHGVYDMMNVYIKDYIIYELSVTNLVIK